MAEESKICQIWICLTRYQGNLDHTLQSVYCTQLNLPSDNFRYLNSVLVVFFRSYVESKSLGDILDLLFPKEHPDC